MGKRQQAKMTAWETSLVYQRLSEMLKGIQTQYWDARVEYSSGKGYDAQRLGRLFRSALNRAIYYAKEVATAHYRQALDEKDPGAIERLLEVAKTVDEVWPGEEEWTTEYIKQRVGYDRSKEEVK